MKWHLNETVTKSISISLEEFVPLVVKTANALEWESEIVADNTLFMRITIDDDYRYNLVVTHTEDGITVSCEAKKILFQNRDCTRNKIDSFFTELTTTMTTLSDKDKELLIASYTDERDYVKNYSLPKRLSPPSTKEVLPAWLCISAVSIIVLAITLLLGYIKTRYITIGITEFSFGLITTLLSWTILEQYKLTNLFIPRLIILCITLFTIVGSEYFSYVLSPLTNQTTFFSFSSFILHKFSLPIEVLWLRLPGFCLVFFWAIQGFLFYTGISLLYDYKLAVYLESMIPYDVKEAVGYLRNLKEATESEINIYLDEHGWIYQIDREMALAVDSL